MSDGSYNEGNCLICDAYTKSSSFGTTNLCSSCHRIFGVQNKHELFKTIGKLREKLKEQGNNQEKPILPKYHHKQIPTMDPNNSELHVFNNLITDLSKRMYDRFKYKLKEENFSGWDIYSEYFKSDLLVSISEKIEFYDSNPDKHLIDCLNLIAMLWNFETETKGEY